jgi:hypothetical protein
MDIFDDLQKIVKKVIIAGDLNAKHVEEKISEGSEETSAGARVQGGI